MADVVDAANAGASAPPMNKAAPPRSMMSSSIDDTPTEPATSPRMLDSQVRECPVECQLSAGEIGLRDEWDRRAREAALREKEEHERSMEEWKAQVEGQGFEPHPALPLGPPPKETSSMRVLPDVYEALRQHDPSRAPGSQPVLKKAPPPTGRPRPKAFYSESEPPRIGTAPVQPPPPPKPVYTWDVQAQGMFHPLTATPMTPGNPPRPPIEALPKPMPIETSQATHKHPLPQPAQQGLPNKQVRHKAFPHDQQPPTTVSMASPSTVDMPMQGTPSPKGPPASFMPTPACLQEMCRTCRPVRQQPIKRIFVVAEGTEGCVQQPTSIGITPLMSSLNRISQEVQIHPSPSKTCVYFASRSPDWIIATSMRSVLVTM